MCKEKIRLFHSWLDQWDERRARRGEEAKTVTGFALDAELAFDGAVPELGLDGFCALAAEALVDPSYFDDDSGDISGCRAVSGHIEFPSSIVTDVEENNVVRAEVTEGRSRGRALVVFHHWNAKSHQRLLSKVLSLCGITVFEIEMPYHFNRSRPGSAFADYMLSPNLGRTVQSMRQAVLDGRRLIRCLKREGYQEISVLGMSLGSWVAGLVAAREPAVSKAALFLTAGNLADMVWTGRATRHIRESLERELDLPDLRRAWALINLENHVTSLARPDLDLQVVLARRDAVVLPELSERLVERLLDAGARVDAIRLNCGHYSLALPPYIVAVGLRLVRFLWTEKKTKPGR